MNAQHTPTPKWRTGFGPKGAKFVFVEGNAKPINAGSAERAFAIVRRCNAHDDLVAALRLAESFLGDEYAETRDPETGRRYTIVCAALAKAGA